MSMLHLGIQYLLWKPCTEHGPPALHNINMLVFLQHSMWPVTRLRKPLIHLCPLWQWVGDMFTCWYHIITSKVHLVLNPKEKMLHFKKHWFKELQGDVLKCLEEVVYLILIIIVIILVTTYSSRSSIYNKTTNMNQPKSSPKTVKKGIH